MAETTTSTVYATSADLQALGIGTAVIAAMSAPQVAQALAAASETADSYLRAQFTLPLLQWGQDLVRAVAAIAAYDLLAARGFDPNGSAADGNIRMRYDDALRWLDGVAAGRVTPNVTDSASGSTPGMPSGGPRVFSSSSRGWRNTRGDGGPYTGD